MAGTWRSTYGSRADYDAAARRANSGSNATEPARPQFGSLPRKRDRFWSTRKRSPGGTVAACRHPAGTSDVGLSRAASGIAPNDVCCAVRDGACQD
jgi:hypothetical protein